MKKECCQMPKWFEVLCVKYECGFAGILMVITLYTFLQVQDSVVSCLISIWRYSGKATETAGEEDESLICVSQSVN